MNWLASAMLIAAMAPLSIVAGGGLNARAAFSFAFVAACILFVTYLSSRTDRPARGIETVVATAWLFFRRLVGLLGAATFLAGAAVVGFGLTAAFESTSLLVRIPLALVLTSAGCFCAWVGVFGQGDDRFSFKDDVALHRANKRRYRWRW